MLWLAVHLPLLSLEACCAALPAGCTQPVALVAEHRISHADAAAQERGVRPGMKRATALALAPELLLAEADPARDAAALLAVAHAALAFTPAVALHDDATVVLEVQASLRLFGGLAALHARLREALATLNPPTGHRVRVAAAPTALGAALLARWGPGASAARAEADSAARPAAAARPSARPLASPAASTAAASPSVPPATPTPSGFLDATAPATFARLLEAVPLGLLAAGWQHAEVLQGMGLATVAHLRGLPRAGLTRRFGAGLLDELDRASGRIPDPRPWLALPERFEARLELQHRADSAEQVLHAAAVLLARLTAWAQGRHARIAAFTLSMKHEPRHSGAAALPGALRGVEGGGVAPRTELRVALAEPALDPAHLQLLLRERLAQVTLAAPTLELQLRCQHLVAAAPPNGELFPTRQSEALGLARLLERLGARLGDERVQCLLPVADHRPERATRAVPALSQLAALTRPAPLPSPAGSAGSAWSAGSAGQALSEFGALPLHRPVWLLPEPRPLPERGTLPVLDGQPLQLVSGPERIEAGWWDGGTVARDYFIALAPDGALLWVWRNRLPGAGVGREQGAPWMLQGLFG